MHFIYNFIYKKLIFNHYVNTLVFVYREKLRFNTWLKMVIEIVINNKLYTLITIRIDFQMAFRLSSFGGCKSDTNSEKLIWTNEMHKYFFLFL